jgi:uncharacterized tellurite resistance protein B-like protein
MSKHRDLINIAPAFYGISVVPKKYWQQYGYALLTIAGADGEVSDPELDWLTQDLANALSVPDEIVAAWEDFDAEDGDLEEIFASIDYSNTFNFAKWLIYDAIRMSSADHDYSDDERHVVSEAARILRLPQETIMTIEALIDLEKAAEKLRLTIF